MILDYIKRNIGYLPLIWQHKLLLYRLAYNYYSVLILRRPRMKQVQLTITNECNINCEHCYMRGQYPAKSIMPIEMALDICQQAKKLGAFNVYLQGGEAMLHPDLLSMIMGIRRETKDFIICMTTNCTMIKSKRILQDLQSAGISYLNVSIDEFRGISSDTLNTIEWGYEIGMRIDICTVVTHQNLPTIQKFIDKYLTFKIRYINLLPCVAMGGLKGCTDILLTDEDWKILDAIISSNKRIKSDYWQGYDTMFGTRCPGGRETIHITPTGDVTHCSLSPLIFGNLAKLPLKDIWHRMMQSKYFDYPYCTSAGNKEFISDILKEKP